MEFTETKLKGAFVIDLQKREDERGFFARAWCEKEFKQLGLTSHMVQANISLNKKRGTVRGLHYQAAPWEEAKLVRCIRGEIFDVLVDLRIGSPTYKQWLGFELTADNRRMLYVPKGFAHGYQSLVDGAEVFYQVSQFYSPDSERGARWNDPSFGIEWPVVDNVSLSEKDQNWPDFIG